MSKYFYHGTDLDNLISILMTKEIKCRKMLCDEKIKTSIRFDYSNPGYNGREYISVCMPNSDSLAINSAYKLFIKNGFCAIIDGNIEAIKTLDSGSQIIKKKYKDEYEQFKINNEDSEYRFSDLKDEWQVKYSIPIDKIVGIAIPFNKINCNIFNPRKIKLLINLARQNNLLIVDSSDKLFSDEQCDLLMENDIDMEDYEVSYDYLCQVMKYTNERIARNEYGIYEERNIIDIVKRKVLSWKKAR